MRDFLRRLHAPFGGEQRKPQAAQGPKRGGTIGEISAEVGYDLRDLYVGGYSNAQIWKVRNGEMTLSELLNAEPDNKTSR